jgi:hypothetical protein
MRYAIKLVPLDFSQGNVIDVRLRGPCTVVGSCVIAERPNLLIAKNGSAQHAAKAALVVHFDPEAAEITRRFVGVVPEMVVDTLKEPLMCDQMKHVATVFTPQGMPIAIYEAPIPEPAQPIEAPPS